MVFRNMRRHLSKPEEFEARYCFDGVPVVEFVDQAEGELAYPDFSLVDTNVNSPTYGQDVSPSDYLGEVSAWYFGHAS
jgi:hypothetical protein